MSHNTPKPTADSVRDAVLAETGVEVDVVDLLRSVAEHIGAAGHGARWAVFRTLIGHGSGVSAAVLRALGLDPNEEVGACLDCGGSGWVPCPDSYSHNDDFVCDACEDEAFVACEGCAGTGSEAIRMDNIV